MQYLIFASALCLAIASPIGHYYEEHGGYEEIGGGHELSGHDLGGHHQIDRVSLGEEHHGYEHEEEHVDYYVSKRLNGSISIASATGFKYILITHCVIS